METATRTQPSAFTRYRAGDAAAFDQVVAEYASPAYATAVKVLADPSLAEEAVQEAFVRIWRNAHKFESARGNERTWILSVVRNQSIDMLRKRNRHPESDIDAVPGMALLRDPEDPWKLVAQKLQSSQVKHALDQLPAEQRGVIQLAFFAGMRSVDIARSLNLPEGTVRSRMRLGLGKLREMLKNTDLAPLHKVA
jgi:RNA polymerase sigma-70 factor, ECF subfamily